MSPDSREKKRVYEKSYRARFFADPVNAARRRVYNLSRRTQSRKAELRREYGITQEHYDLMLKHQQGRCAICGTDSPKVSTGQIFHVDHDRLLGEVRGLLCGLCNRGLGHFKDDIDRLEQAVHYLRGKRLIDLIADETRRRAEEWLRA